MQRLRDAQGAEAVVGRSFGYWLAPEDFVSADEDRVDARALGSLGFPRDWPAVYRESAGLKALIGKRGRLAGQRVAVAGLPSDEDRARVSVLQAQPLHSFANAELAAERTPGVAIVRGWAIFECLDQPAGRVFVAERYWWNALPDGRWVDLTPRPKSWDRLLLTEAACGAPKSPCALTAEQAKLTAFLLERRFPPEPSPPSAKPARGEGVPAPAPAAAPAPASPNGAKAKGAKAAAGPPPATAPAPASPSRAEAKGAKTLPVAAGKADRKRGVDYSKFKDIQDSDDEKPVVKPDTVELPLGMPREAVSREDYNKVWRLLLEQKQLPFLPAPDLDSMWGFYKYGGMDEQALLDQACEYLGKFPARHAPAEYKAQTYSLMKKLETSGRDDEARMWSVIYMCRYPSDPDGYYNQGVLLNKMADKVKFGGGPTARLHSADGAPARAVPSEQYCSLFVRAAVGYYRRALKVDPKQRPVYINLIGTLERNEPPTWYEDVQELGVAAVKHGLWYNRWQRPPHFVPTLAARPIHDPYSFAMCRALEEKFTTIQDEYTAYIDRLAHRREWDDTDNTPGMGEVGARAGALHDGGLTKSGKWKEVPLFTNCSLRHEYAEFFPETIKVLTECCKDAVGLALCGGGDVILSVLTPGTRLRPHCGPSNARLTCHLGVRVPRTLEQGCRLRVAAEAPIGWEEGKCLVFDDSFEHEVFYEEAGDHEAYPGDRVVLLANFWHPDFALKNDPDWRTKSDQVMAKVDVESLPQTALVKA